MTQPTWHYLMRGIVKNTVTDPAEQLRAMPQLNGQLNHILTIVKNDPATGANGALYLA